MRGIEFTSRLPRHKRHALERILFFDGCQDRFARGIVDVIDKYGPPEIVDDGEGLRVRVGTMPEVQCQFAVETLTARPVGVAVYNRAFALRVPYWFVRALAKPSDGQRSFILAKTYISGGV